tara:strand:- start:26 stop:958 length:933 start_codon:yes stop_codon:yes gene_type:complete
MESNTKNQTEDLYQIGTAAKLTGISVERLRAWERRYGIKPVHRSGRTRFYSKNQLDWLHKIKLLLESGHTIGALAGLTSEKLDERLSERNQNTDQPIKIGLIGTNLLLLESENEKSSELNIRSRWTNFSEFQGHSINQNSIDVLVVQLPTIVLQSVDSIRQSLPSCRIICVYQFATDDQLDLLQEMRITRLHWPVSWNEIERACFETILSPRPATKSTPRKFSDNHLLALAKAPKHDSSNYLKYLVELITELNAFADYSEGFLANQHPNSELYKQIHADTTKARAQLELAVEASMKFEQKRWKLGINTLD